MKIAGLCLPLKPQKEKVATNAMIYCRFIASRLVDNICKGNGGEITLTDVQRNWKQQQLFL